MTLLLIIGLALFAMSAPPALREQSLTRFGQALMLSLVGIIVPLLAFFASACFTPAWKGECRHGWLDCFHAGKLLLTPLMLWASSSLYEVDILRREPPMKRWVGQGLLLGAVVNSGWFLFGVSVDGLSGGGWWFIPLYTAIWYWVRAVQFTGTNASLADHARALSCSLPLWIGSLLLSRGCYSELPDRPPTCFVVTAASHGHRKWVGPFFPTRHRGRRRWANVQLLVFWQFEALWRERSPYTHAAFRRIYDRWGPVLARRIASPWRSDAAYVLLKPAEWLAGLAVRLLKVHPGKGG